MVTLQEIAGCCHHRAARRTLVGQEIGLAPSTRSQALFADKQLVGPATIENSIAVYLLQDDRLLRNNSLRVIDVYVHPFSLLLAALPATTDSVYDVNSHPIAPMLCEEYLEVHQATKPGEKNDTGSSARAIVEHKLAGHAAGGNELAAAISGLHFLEKSIETDKDNFTRVLMPADENRTAASGSPDAFDKASRVLRLPHTGQTGKRAGHPRLLRHQPVENPVAADHRPRVRIPFLRRCSLLRSDPHHYRRAVDAVAPLRNELKIHGQYKACADTESGSKK